MALIGITGTRALDDLGRANIVALLSYLDPKEDAVIVGGCVGVDAFAGQVAKTMGLTVHVVLPEDDSQVDPSWASYADTWEVGGPYRQRNERIVQLADGVWAFPNHATQREDPHSGTWMTINIAKRAKKLAYLTPQHPPSTDVAPKGGPRCECGHLRHEHRKDSLRGDACYLCDCRGWKPTRQKAASTPHRPR